MKKSRSITDAYWGKAYSINPINGNKMYYAGSGSVYVPTILAQYPEYFGEEAALQRYNAARPLAATNVTILPSVNKNGYEMIESTERKCPLPNNCVHNRDTLVNLPYLSNTQKHNAANTVYTSSYFRKGISHTLGTYVPDPVDLEGARRRAWAEMQPRFEGSVSMLNFLFELKDFKSMLRLMLKPGNLGLIASMRQYGSMLRKGLLSPLKTLAQLHLVNQFALKPLISDFIAIAQQCALVTEEAEAKFCSDGTMWQKRHYTEELEYAKTGSVGTYNNYYLHTGTIKQSSFTGTLHYKYDYKARTSFDAFKAYWGLSFTPEVIWNAIPFSFLVDYFVKIGNSLHAARLDPNVKLTDFEYTESVLRTRRTGISLSQDSRSRCFVIDGVYHTPESSDKILLSGALNSMYERWVAIPNYGTALPRFTLPSKGQFTNMAALFRCFLS